MVRCKPNGDGNNQSVIDGFADTRNDPIKRRKIHRVLDFLERNREAYREYLALDEKNAAERMKVL